MEVCACVARRPLSHGCSDSSLYGTIIIFIIMLMWIMTLLYC